MKGWHMANKSSDVNPEFKGELQVHQDLDTALV